MPSSGEVSPLSCGCGWSRSGRRDDQEQTARKELYEDLGWTSTADMTTIGSVLRRPRAPGSYTDPESLSWAWKKLPADRWNVRGYLALLGGQALVSMAVFGMGHGREGWTRWSTIWTCLLDFVAPALPFPFCA